MFHYLNILHAILVLAALGCVPLARTEIRGRPMPRGRLMLLPLLAAIIAVIFLLFFLSLRQPVWMFITPLLIGLAVGVARGLSMSIKHDHDFLLVRSKARPVLLLVVLTLVVSVALEIGGSLAGPAGATVRLVAADVAVSEGRSA